MEKHEKVNLVNMRRKRCFFHYLIVVHSIYVFFITCKFFNRECIQSVMSYDPGSF